MIYDIFKSENKLPKTAILIDPDKYTDNSFSKTIKICHQCKVDFLMIGGSLISKPLDTFINEVKKQTDLPVVLFPGSLLQISDKADAILLLSLISGRNPDFLIGNHVLAAPVLKNSGLEIIPTGYMLIESGKMTSVQYISNTTPIPSNKPDIAVATAIAGEMLGLKTIYLEAGSGANHHVPDKIISSVKKNISIPLIVGGGIRSHEHYKTVYSSGADIIVIGNSIENNPEILTQILTS